MQQRTAAKFVYQSPYRTHPEILKATNEELLKGYNRPPSPMGGDKYAQTLRKVCQQKGSDTLLDMLGGKPN